MRPQRKGTEMKPMIQVFSRVGDRVVMTLIEVEGDVFEVQTESGILTFKTWAEHRASLPPDQVAAEAEADARAEE